jgi:hypothetical protein
MKKGLIIRGGAFAQNAPFGLVETGLLMGGWKLAFICQRSEEMIRAHAEAKKNTRNAAGDRGKLKRR